MKTVMLYRNLQIHSNHLCNIHKLVFKAIIIQYILKSTNQCNERNFKNRKSRNCVTEL